MWDRAHENQDGGDDGREQRTNYFGQVSNVKSELEW
jgi:hypothetical protein